MEEKRTKKGRSNHCAVRGAGLRRNIAGSSRVSAHTSMYLICRVSNLPSFGRDREVYREIPILPGLVSAHHCNERTGTVTISYPTIYHSLLN